MLFVGTNVVSYLFVYTNVMLLFC